MKEDALNNPPKEKQLATAREEVIERSYKLVQNLGFKDVKSFEEVKAIIHLRALLVSLFQWQGNNLAHVQHYADQVLREATLVDGKILFNPYPSCANCTTELSLDIRKISDWFIEASEEYWQGIGDSENSR